MSDNSNFSGVQAVSERQQFDTGALEDYLREHLPGFTGPLTVEQFKGGQSNPTFRLSDPHNAWVMRSKPGPAAKLLKSAHAIDREFRVMKALAQTDVPVARVDLLCEDESVIGRAFYIMQYMDGRILWEQSLPDSSKKERGEIYDEMNRVIAALHQVDFEQIGLGDFGRPGNYFERQISRWTKQYRLSETETIPAMNNLIDWLPDNIPAGDETSIVHGDYRLDNMVFHPQKSEVIAVLDWELSTIGHPLADFSYHCMGFHIAPGQFRGIAGLDLPELGIPTEAQYVQKYCERTGRAGIDNWSFYIAYNMFRLSGILQGIVKRAQDGTAASEKAAEAGARAKPLAEMGWAIVERDILGRG